MRVRQVVVFGSVAVLITLIVVMVVQATRPEPDDREIFVPDSGFGLTQEQWDSLGTQSAE